MRLVVSQTPAELQNMKIGDVLFAFVDQRAHGSYGSLTIKQH